MYIGIIGAMDIEIKNLKEKLENLEVININFLEFYTGTIGNTKIVLVKCFEGKVNSAIATQIMINNFNVDLILNIGVAGGISDELDIGGIAISNSTVECDLDTTKLGYNLGYAFGLEKVIIECDKKTCDKIYGIAKISNNVVVGTIASSDKFISDEEYKKMLKEKFNAVAVDMESASISHVCALNNVPFCAVRAISDNTSTTEYKDFVDIAIEKLDSVLMSLFKIETIE